MTTCSSINGKLLVFYRNLFDQNDEREIMKDHTCFYCMKNEKLDALMSVIYEFKYSTLYLLHDQSFAGRCVLALNDHKTEVFQLDPDEHHAFFKDLSISTQAVWELFNPQKLNYAVFGDFVPHFHVHIAPKYENGLNWGKPFCENPGEPQVLSGDELDSRIELIRNKILELLK